MKLNGIGNIDYYSSDEYICWNYYKGFKPPSDPYFEDILQVLIKDLEDSKWRKLWHPADEEIKKLVKLAYRIRSGELMTQILDNEAGIVMVLSNGDIYYTETKPGAARKALKELVERVVSDV